MSVFKVLTYRKETEMEKTNHTNRYARFYAALGEIPYDGDRADLKCNVVSQFTLGRTTHLHEMSPREYRAACDALERISGRRERLKKGRSSCLKLMQKLGINTADWSAVDNFCQNPRIAGKRFCQITTDELTRLRAKLYAILNAGGLKNRAAEAAERRTAEVIYVDDVSTLGRC